VFTALLDTCVLWPNLQRDFLLSLAVEGLYRPIWSATILEELAYGETRKLIDRGVEPDEAARRAQRLVTEMRRAFDDAEIDGWQGLEGTYGLPDPDDEHVVAAAVVGGAGAIITVNRKDFPVVHVPAAVQVLPPETFAANTVELSPTRAVVAVQGIVARSGRLGRRLTPVEVLDCLASRYGMVRAVELLKPFMC
jgi:predicted nucleic acid-binding protein